jgi:hypothetical protein
MSATGYCCVRVKGAHRPQVNQLAAEARETGIIGAHLLPFGRRVNVPAHALA